MFFQKIEEEVKLPNSLYEPSISLKTKVEIDTSRKLQTDIPHDFEENIVADCLAN